MNWCETHPKYFSILRNRFSENDSTVSALRAPLDGDAAALPRVPSVHVGEGREGALPEVPRADAAAQEKTAFQNGAYRANHGHLLLERKCVGFRKIYYQHFGLNFSLVLLQGTFLQRDRRRRHRPRRGSSGRRYRGVPLAEL